MRDELEFSCSSTLHDSEFDSGDAKLSPNKKKKTATCHSFCFCPLGSYEGSSERNLFFVLKRDPICREENPANVLESAVYDKRLLLRAHAPPSKRGKEMQ
jgi:hypothetical protein